MAVRLSDKFCDAAKGDPSGKRREHLDALVPGLAFIVQPSGKRSWGVRYRDMERRPVKVTLGPYPMIALGEAREQAREVLQKVAKGADPAAEKRSLKRIVFTDAPSRTRDLWWTVVEQYLQRDASALRSHDSIKSILERETKDRWSSKLIHEITKREVISMVDAVVDRGAPIAANRALAHTRRVFNWALSRDLISVNPCSGIEKQAESKRDRVLSRAELTDIWSVADGLGYPFGPMVQMLILTGQRLREVAEAEWHEFDLDAGLWEIPPVRAKNDERHVVPLAPAVVDLIREQPKLGKPAKYLFTTTLETPVSGFARAKQKLDEEIAKLDLKRGKAAGLSPAEIRPREPWTFHDIRRTMASGMAELGVMFEVIERTLNHKGASRGGVAGVYNRHQYLDEKRSALVRWAQSIAFDKVDHHE